MDDYRRLRAAWAEKLRSTGFHDIETRDGQLKRSSSSLAGRYRRETADYYRLAYHFLNRFKFKDPIDKKIWSHHSDGLSTREISDRLKVEGISLSHVSIAKKINEFKRKTFVGGKKEVSLPESKKFLAKLREIEQSEFATWGTMGPNPLPNIKADNIKDCLDRLIRASPALKICAIYILRVLEGRPSHTLFSQSKLQVDVDEYYGKPAPFKVASYYKQVTGILLKPHRDLFRNLMPSLKGNSKPALFMVSDSYLKGRASPLSLEKREMLARGARITLEHLDCLLEEGEREDFHQVYPPKVQGTKCQLQDTRVQNEENLKIIGNSKVDMLGDKRSSCQSIISTDKNEFVARSSNGEE